MSSGKRYDNSTINEGVANKGKRQQTSVTCTVSVPRLHPRVTRDSGTYSSAWIAYERTVGNDLSSKQKLKDFKIVKLIEHFNEPRLEYLPKHFVHPCHYL